VNEPADDQALKALHLSAEIVHSIAETADGYGNALHSRPVDQLNLLRAGTMKVLAGGCWALLGSDRADSAFAAATVAYERLGRPISKLTGICAGSLQVRPQVDDEQSRAATPLAYHALLTAWRLIHEAAPEPELAAVVERLAHTIERWDPRPSGQLGIPLYFYVELLVRIHAGQAQGDQSAQLNRLPARLLARAAEPVRAAMIDDFHWSRLQSGLMPVEPELLTIGRILHLLLPHDWDERMLDDLGIGEGVDRVPLWLARHMDPPANQPSDLPRYPRIPSTPADSREVSGYTRSWTDHIK
jgi:hypothetical protein